MATDMLFPRPRQQAQEDNAPVNNDAKQAELQSTIEDIDAKRWQYTQDLFIEDRLQFASRLPKEPETFTPEELSSGGGFITLEPREPLTSGFIGILTSRGGLIEMLQRAPTAIHRVALEASVKGQVAGSILWYMYVMSRCDNIAPSLTKARDLCLDRYPRRFNYPKGRPAKTRTRVIHSLTNGDLKKIWREYQPVAHLWASYLAMKNDQLEPIHMPLDNIQLADFLGAAQLLAKFGCEFRIPGTGDQRPLDRGQLAWPPKRVERDLPHLEKKLLNNEVVSFVRAFDFKSH
ncbi:MAG: hypothetical protein IPN64_00315 [Propionivibrio sp.]|uniref:hypothetical protein n=1 Tax=Propionivibrio sp. TaxID=2212460 RepID=UPI0025CE9656|nr:hypothetical protein [Propionivibrio sp.]MBK8892537.1 hypothetical protein [Propionivibrio sp.]